MLTGSLTGISSTGDNTISVGGDVGNTHVTISAANAAGVGGASGSVLEFDYISATGVVVNGALQCTHASPTLATTFGSGDIG